MSFEAVDPAFEERRKAILTVLRDLQPDVIGLQEVWARDGENLAEWLASHLDMHWTWAASRAPERWQRRIGDSTVDIGNAVLSRWPIAEHDRRTAHPGGSRGSDHGGRHAAGRACRRSEWRTGCLPPPRDIQRPGRRPVTPHGVPLSSWNARSGGRG
ncbi:hypothetical protein G7Z12_00935 [Streptomyces sp. ID38640]|nr:hypothetical protein G7Z12_00935 [Streptomyces sp. ID38640]